MAETDRTVAAAPATGPATAADRSLSPALQHILHWFAHLSEADLERISRFYAPDCHFKDPFNDVRGTAQVRAVYAHMFATTQQPRFVIGQVLEQGQAAAVYWRFQCRAAGHDIDVAGMSALRLDDQGRICEHIDYWDSADLFMHFPVLRQLLGWLKRRLALPLTARAGRARPG